MKFTCLAVLSLCLCTAARGVAPAPALVVRQDRERILQAANEALEAAPESLTQHRSPLNPGTEHEFFSMSDYYWPDPSKPDGRPYVMRDGQSNPGNFNGHREALMAMRDRTSALACAWLLTRDEKYAEKAVRMLRVFFLDEATRMTPSLEHAQAIIGKPTPDRGTGLIDTLHLIETPLCILALRDAKAMTPETFAALRQWFADYLKWFIQSPKGRNEAKATNNHAVAYWLQVAAFATLTKDDALLAQCRRQFKEVFVAVQMGSDGGFPLELRRTKPYAYSIFQLDLMSALCQLLSTPEENLWAFTTADGRCMAKALTFLAPYLKDKSAWPKPPDVNAWEGWPVRQPALLLGGLAFKDNDCLDLWRALKPDPRDFEIRRNNAITQPLLWTSLLPAVSAVKRLRAQDVFKPDRSIIFSDDFSDDKLSRWNFSEDDRYSLLAPSPKRIRVVEAPHSSAGSKAVRFEVPHETNCFRAEISLPSEDGCRERWYAAQVLVPEDWQTDTSKGQDIVLQWHGIPGNWKPTYPNLSIGIAGGSWLIQQSFGSPQDGPGRFSKRLDQAVEPGKWAAWVIHAKWSPRDDGSVRIWKDGKEVLHRVGANVYGTIGRDYTPYLKTGIYHPEWHLDTDQKRQAFQSDPRAPATKVIYVRDIRVGGPNARLTDILSSKP